MSQQEYLTVADALAMVLGAVSQLPAEMVPLGQALGRVLAAPAVARDNLPPFANSAMDGFAVRAADVSDASRGNPARLRVVADVAAGHVPDVVVGEGCAARIMTGAPLPAGADAVIPVEDTDEAWRDEARPLPEQVQLFRSVGVGDYVRQAGEDIRVGAEIIPAGKQLRPQEIGVLASIGQAEVQVVRQPRVGILATGDELIDVDQPLQPGKIRNSNGYAQEAQVRAAGAIPVPLGIARDTLVDVRDRLQAGLDAGVDLFVSSAGVSVGAYDVVKAVLDASGDVR
ncbi:MAG: molybdopterin molybdotransferase MoeA, partial [Anaerolineales bacterium]|nr:molybdopterin molybdotransferase MoeA [Anaerolineales bacterium]